VILHHALKIKLYCICDQLDRRLVQVNAVCSCDERQWMNLQAFGQCLNNANARYLMALLNSAHVTPAGCHQHVLLRQTAQGTQLYTGTPDEYQRFIGGEKTKWAEIVKRANIKMD